MSKVKTFKVKQSKDSQTSVQVSLTVGSTPDDQAWQDLNLSQDDINEKAIQSVVIDFQGYARRNWERFKANPQAFADAWTAGRKASAQVRIDKEQVKDLKLTKAQIDGLRAITGLMIEV